MGKDNLLQEFSTGMMSTNSLILNIQLINIISDSRYINRQQIDGYVDIQIDRYIIHLEGTIYKMHYKVNISYTGTIDFLGLYIFPG